MLGSSAFIKCNNACTIDELEGGLWSSTCSPQVSALIVRCAAAAQPEPRSSSMRGCWWHNFCNNSRVQGCSPAGAGAWQQWGWHRRVVPHHCQYLLMHCLWSIRNTAQHHILITTFDFSFRRLLPLNQHQHQKIRSLWQRSILSHLGLNTEKKKRIVSMENGFQLRKAKKKARMMFSRNYPLDR